MNSSIKKMFAVSLAAVMSTAILAGCGKKETASSSTKTLRVTMALSEEEWAVMRKSVIPQFEKENNAKVEAIQVEAKDVVKKLEAMKAAGKTEIDLIAQDVNNIAPLVSKGLVEDLSSYTSVIPKESINTLVDAGKFGDKTYFLPYRPNVEINYYNENKFNQYGLKTPTTWDELLNAAKTLKEKEGIGRVALKIKLSGDVIEIVEFIREAGGDPLVLNDEGTIKAYTFLQQLWPYLSDDTLKASFSATNGFLANESVYYAPNWPFGVNVIVKEGGKKEIKATAGFSGPNGMVKTLGGEVIGIPAGSLNKDLAVKFAEYLMSKDVQRTLVTQLGWPSFRSDVYAEVEDWQKPYFEAVQEGLKVAKPLSNVPYWAEVNQAINDSLKEVVVDRKDVKTTLDKYAKVIQKAKSDYENNK